MPQAQAQLASSLILAGLDSVGRSVSSISVIAVGKGPGSYTGLRIGVSIAKGISFGLGIPIVSVGALENLSRQVFHKYEDAEFSLPMIDARRDEAYLGISDTMGNWILPPCSSRLSDLSIPANIKNKRMVLAGSGGRKAMEWFGNPPNWLLDPELEPDATVTAKIAFEKWQRNEVEDPGTFEPDYLKPVFIAKPN